MNAEMTNKLIEQFKREIDAHCRYKELLTWVEDEYLKDAVEEIMYDEYLHAKFIRSYLMSKDAYKVSENEEAEKRYLKMYGF